MEQVDLETEVQRLRTENHLLHIQAATLQRQVDETTTELQGIRMRVQSLLDRVRK